MQLQTFDSLQREKIKQKYGGVDRAIEQGSAYRVLRSIFPTKELIPDKDNSVTGGQQVTVDFLSNGVKVNQVFNVTSEVLRQLSTFRQEGIEIRS